MSEILNTNEAISSENAPETSASALEAENNSAESTESEQESSSNNSEWDSKFAALSRKEKSIRERESELEAKLAQFEEQQKAYQESQKEPEKEPELPLEYRLKKDPIGTLRELGLGYDKLTELALNDGKLTPDMQIQLMREELQREMEDKYGKSIEELKNELSEKEEAKATQEYEQTVQNYLTHINELINESDEFELTRAEDAADLVLEVQQEYYEQNNEVLDDLDAIRHVEQFLEGEYEKKKSLSKVRRLFEPQKQAEATIPEKKQVTLSNEQSSEVPSREPSSLSEEDYRKRAMAMLKWVE